MFLMFSKKIGLETDAAPEKESQKVRRGFPRKGRLLIWRKTFRDGYWSGFRGIHSAGAISKSRENIRKEKKEKVRKKTKPERYSHKLEKNLYRQLGEGRAQRRGASLRRLEVDPNHPNLSSKEGSEKGRG